MNDFLKILAWNQAPNHFFLNSGQWRVDFAGKLIYWQAYGDRSHPYGWELGHITPRIEGGSDHWYNIQAEHWTTNLSKEALRKQQVRLSMPQTLFGGNPEVQRTKHLPHFL